MNNWIGLMIAGIAIVAAVWFWEAHPSTCVHLTDTKPFNLVVRGGRFMYCRTLNDDSLDVECRVLEERPYR